MKYRIISSINSKETRIVENCRIHVNHGALVVSHYDGRIEVNNAIPFMILAPGHWISMEELPGQEIASAFFGGRFEANTEADISIRRAERDQLVSQLKDVIEQRNEALHCADVAKEISRTAYVNAQLLRTALERIVASYDNNTNDSIELQYRIMQEIAREALRK